MAVSRNTKILAGTACAILMTVASGVTHGYLSNRWGPSNELQLAAAHLAKFPTDIGGWQSVEDQEMDEDTRRILDCAGYVNRRYTKNGQQIGIAVIVGPPGPTAVHTPEICYSSREYEIHDTRTPLELESKNGKTHSFWQTKFRSKRPTGDQIEVCYGWNDGTTWVASESPRYAFGGRRYLYKVQLAAQIDPRKKQEYSACADFLQSLLNSSWDTTPADSDASSRTASK